MDPNAKVIPLSLHPAGFIEAFTHFGADFDELLRGTGIDRQLLTRKGAKISYAQQNRLIRNGVSLCDKPGLGLLVGLHFDWSYFGTVGNVVYCSPTLKDAAMAFRRYAAIAQPFYAARSAKPTGYVDDHGMYAEQIRTFPTADRNPRIEEFETEFRLAITVRLWDMCANKSVADPSIHVRLGYPEPPHADLYRQLPCTTLQFGCRQTEVAGYPPLMLEPFRPLRRHAFNRLLEQCERELRDWKLGANYADKVRLHISVHFNKQHTLEDVAEALGMTPRALTRRLAAENTTFRNIQHDVKMEWTLHHLRTSNMDVDELARLMGFSCASSLRRAVKSMCGKTVSDIRRAATAGAREEAVS
jgi:AraC-like DNA-binding protein